MYEEGFRWWRLGVAAAIAFLLFLLIVAFTIIWWVGIFRQALLVADSGPPVGGVAPGA